MADNTDIISILSTEADDAVDQIIADSKRLHLVINGSGTEQAVTEDGSLIPSVRKALIDNLYFKTPPLEWKSGTFSTEYNQLYSFTDESGNVTWWYSPGATATNPVYLGDSPVNDNRFKVFLDKTNIADIYAPLNSPSFKGNPRVPLASIDDDTDTIASTQWVNRGLKDLESQVADYAKGTFENITVEKDSVLENVYVNGEFVVNTDKLSAPDAEATFRRIRVVGQDAEIAFEQNAASPEGTVTKTNIKPYTVSTGDLSGDSLTAGVATIGDVAASTDSLVVDGYILGDYLHLEGNNRNDSARAQLVVDGIAEIGTLRVREAIEGVEANVDGLDIKPNSVKTSNDVAVGGNASVSGGLGVSGDTKVNNLEVTGSLTGVTLTVDGEDIQPNSVKTGEIESSGSVRIGGDTDSAGKITTQDLEVLGKLTATMDLSGSDLKVSTIDVSQTATIQNLVVTGSTVGVSGDVDGKNINPAKVETSGSVSAGSLTTTGNATVGGDAVVEGTLTVSGEFIPDKIKTGEIEATSLDIPSGTATIKDLVVTGTSTGIYADVTGADIKPATVETTGGVQVGENLSVVGKTTLGDVDFTGTVTGLDLDLSQSHLSVKSVSATDPSVFSGISSTTIDNSQKITTQDLQVKGDILDSDGNPIASLDVTGKDILPNSVQSATYTKTNTLEVDQESTLKGPASFAGGVTVTGGDILSPQGKATFNDVQVNGSLIDSSGATIGSVESIKGKNIEPNSVSATGTVSTSELISAGSISGKGVLVDGDTTTTNLVVGSLSNLSEVRISGPTSGESAEFKSLHIKREVQTDNLRFVVEGDGEIQGDLSVTGTITGKVDLSAQDVVMNSLQVSDGVGAKNITASATVTGANGVFGSETAPGQFGIQSLNNARVAKNLEVEGDLSVSGIITGTFDTTGKALAATSLILDQDLRSETVVASTSVTTKDLRVTGTTDFGSNATIEGAQVKAKLFTVDAGEDITVSTGSWTPDGKQSIYNVTISSDTVINAPEELPGAGTYYFYIDQDSVGGHEVTFSAPYLKIGEDTVNTAPSSTSLVQVIYRGKGNTFDYVVLRRG